MTSADLERLHKELLEYERIDFISDERGAVIEDLWPELVHKLPTTDPGRITSHYGRLSFRWGQAFVL